jgi:hypothetical protein
MGVKEFSNEFGSAFFFPVWDAEEQEAVVGAVVVFDLVAALDILEFFLSFCFGHGPCSANWKVVSSSIVFNKDWVSSCQYAEVPFEHSFIFYYIGFIEEIVDIFFKSICFQGLHNFEFPG